MKKFWRILKKVLMATGVLAVAALFVIVLTSAIKHQNKLVCSSIQVKIDETSGSDFLTEADITERINYLCGRDIVGKTLSTIDFRTIEREIEKNPFVDKAEIFSDQSQKVVVDIIQKRPILRVINSDGVSYYIGEKNERIPLSNRFTAHVAIALGNVETHGDSKRDSTVQIALYHFIQYVRKDEFLDALVDQIYVQQNGEFDLIPKTGSQTIRFGQAGENTEAKFDKLKIFYREGLSKTGWAKYKTINLQYDGQVVCEKRDTTNTL